MTAPSLISHDPAVVKAELLRMFAALLDPLLEGAQAGRLTPRAAELGAWSVVIPLGAAVLTALLAALARFAAGRAVQRLAARWSMFVNDRPRPAASGGGRVTWSSEVTDGRTAASGP